MKRYRCNFDFSKGVWVQGCFVPGLEVMKEPVLSPLPDVVDDWIVYIGLEKERIRQEDRLRLVSIFLSKERYGQLVHYLLGRKDTDHCFNNPILGSRRIPISWRLIVCSVEIFCDFNLRKDEVRGVFE